MTYFVTSSVKLLIFHSYCCLLLGAHVLIVIGALQIYIDYNDDEDGSGRSLLRHAVDQRVERQIGIRVRAGQYY